MEETKELSNPRQKAVPANIQYMNVKTMVTGPYEEVNIFLNPADFDRITRAANSNRVLGILRLKSEEEYEGAK